MIFRTCASVRELLPGFHDGELSLEEQIIVESHLADCSLCVDEAQRLANLGEALRRAAGRRSRIAEPGPALLTDVIGRLSGERAESWPVRMRLMFEDLHLIWAGLGATAATVACVTVALSLLHFASPERADSLAAVLEVLASSDENPVPPDAPIMLPRVSPDVMPAMLVPVYDDDDDVEFTLAAVVSRDGRVTGVEMLGPSLGDSPRVRTLLHAASDTRFVPARFGGSPVAVSMVWLLAHTTVKGS